MKPTCDHVKAGAAGFTLLEVIVAFAIAALALGLLMQAGSSGLFAVDAATRLNQAVELAQSHIAAFGQSGVVTLGKTAGSDVDGYHWEVLARPLAGGGGAQTLYDLQVTISWRNGRRDRSVVLETRKIGPAFASE